MSKLQKTGILAILACGLVIQTAFAQEKQAQVEEYGADAVAKSTKKK